MVAQQCPYLKTESYSRSSLYIMVFAASILIISVARSGVDFSHTEVFVKPTSATIQHGALFVPRDLSRHASAHLAPGAKEKGNGPRAPVDVRHRIMAEAKNSSNAWLHGMWFGACMAVVYGLLKLRRRNLIYRMSEMSYPSSTEEHQTPQWAACSSTAAQAQFLTDEMVGDTQAKASCVYTIMAANPDRLIEAASKELGPDWGQRYGPMVLFTLGINEAACVEAAKSLVDMTGNVVALADCYGLIGYSFEEKANIELMEEGRGQEYGAVGGDGGQGILLVAYSRDTCLFTPMDNSSPPPSCSSWLVVSPSGPKAVEYLQANQMLPYFGGVAKATYIFNKEDQKWSPVPMLLVGDPQGKGAEAGALALSTFTDTADQEGLNLRKHLPFGPKIQIVSTFPCFMRGINLYGRTGVEIEDLAKSLPRTGVRMYGMFCHGELGPVGRWGLVGTEQSGTCSLQSEVTVLGLYSW